jgi:hypothetical protein
VQLNRWRLYVYWWGLDFGCWMLNWDHHSGCCLDVSIGPLSCGRWCKASEDAKE